MNYELMNKHLMLKVCDVGDAEEEQQQQGHQPHAHHTWRRDIHTRSLSSKVCMHSMFIKFARKLLSHLTTF